MIFLQTKLASTRLVLGKHSTFCRILNDLKVVKEIQGMGRASYGHAADVSKLSEVEGLIEASVKNLGNLNVMIANAGIAQVKSLLSLSEDEVRRMFDVNVFGIFNSYSAAAKQMIKQGGGGKIIGAARYVQTKSKPNHMIIY